MTTNRLKLRSWALLLALAGASTSLGAQSTEHAITIISEGGVSTIPLSEFFGVSMLPLETLAKLVGAELRPAAEQGVTLSANGRIARVSDGRNFVPVEGKLVLLQSPARLVSGRWFVPVDFLTKVLPAFSREPLNYRDSERMLVIGDTFPVLEVSSDRDPNFTRVQVRTNREVPIHVTRSSHEIKLEIETPFLRTNFRDEEILDEVVQRITLARKERSYELTVALGERFGNLQASELEAPDHGVELVLLRSRVPTRTAGAPAGGVETIAEDLRSVEEREAAEAAAAAETGEEHTPDEETKEPVTEIVLPDDYATRPTGGPVPPMPPRGPTGPTQLRIVTIDPGHGGSETGAEGADGVFEKDIVLSISRRLRTLLQDRLGLRVILTRDGDRDVELDDRAALANNNKSDLFISIHADASPSRVAKGSSVYFLSYSSTEAQSREVSAATHRSASGSGSGLDFILWDMAQASHLSQSSRMAEIFQEELLAATGSEKVNRGIKQNTFRVLKGATMPAVLVEVGFISNSQEEALLKSEAYQDKLAEALFRGVLRFKDVYEYTPTADSASSSSQGRR